MWHNAASKNMAVIEFPAVRGQERTSRLGMSEKKLHGVAIQGAEYASCRKPCFLHTAQSFA
jgi:hypothetical protein